MNKSRQEEFSCGRCKATIGEKDDFCRNCGAVFSDGLTCRNHASKAAEGMCVICQRPACSDCGGTVNLVFLCDEHSQYETQEGMAPVYGSTDTVQAQFAFDCLTQSGYHPFFYPRMFNPGAGIIDTAALGGERYFGNHPVAEMRILVPFAEVLRAEDTLKELGIQKNSA